jgi:HAD superfamily hydrolase (TIGR01509 family)
MAEQRLHLIWDFDGTLYDAYPAMTADLLAVLASFGVRGEEAEVRRLIKHTVFYGVSTLAASNHLDTQALMAAFRERHRAHTRLPLMPHAAQCLARTARLGCCHYLFTHRDRGAVAMLRADGLDRYFADYVTREDGFAAKPSPEAVLHLMRTHGFAAGDAYMVGDRDIDIRSGQGAGAQGILLDPDEFYPDLTVEHRVQSLREIPRLMNGRLRRWPPLFGKARR